MIFAVQTVHAAPAYTPYANSVAAESGQAAGTAGNAVGPPDGQTTTFAGNSSVTLDMGEGEEGTNSLRLYLGPINLQSTVEVAFLDSTSAVISQQSQQLFINPGTSTPTFAYDWHTSGKAYRFVRITTTVGLGFGVDAVEALGFIGSTADQDTDGDGIPDRQDPTPLVFDPPANGGGSGGGSGGSSGGGSSTGGGLTNSGGTVNRTVTVFTGAGPTATINNPPPAQNDLDGDQMDDGWERSHGLDPGNKNDATLDADHDGLQNLQEYQFDLDPRKFDTDGDGMPDGWEVSYGLNARVIDADQDPDGDYITNLGEYNYNTNPYHADNFRNTANEATSPPITVQDQISYGLFLLGAFILFMMVNVLTAAPTPKDGSSALYRFRHRAYRLIMSRLSGKK